MHVSLQSAYCSKAGVHLGCNDSEHTYPVVGFVLHYWANSSHKLGRTKVHHDWGRHGSSTSSCFQRAVCMHAHQALISSHSRSETQRWVSPSRNKDCCHSCPPSTPEAPDPLLRAPVSYVLKLYATQSTVHPMQGTIASLLWSSFFTRTLRSKAALASRQPEQSSLEADQLMSVVE